MPKNATNQHAKSTGQNRPSTPVARTAKQPDIKFLNVELGESQKSACGHWIASQPDIWAIMDGLISEGYKVSHSIDKRTGAHMATITDRRENSQFADHCFTIRGRDYGTALLRLCWVHTCYLDGDWSNIGGNAADNDLW